MRYQGALQEQTFVDRLGLLTLDYRFAALNPKP